MNYLLLIRTDTGAEPYRAEDDNIEDWVAELEKSGRRADGDRLRPIEEAKTVRLRQGRLDVTDGPFAEAKEWVAGYDILECDSIDEAVGIAAKHPMARFGRIEVREIWKWE
ncbi:YciI family protein [Leifsonia sp. NPDC058248]|uniref:YciI family protein n=1 Tax=Leifsonia sp. NPDC058248 TaxID=3346402 RepID=UPI0036D8B8CC